MGLFDKKKKESGGLHTLSEKDIQNKLYGRFYRSENSAAGEDSREPATLSSRKQISRPLPVVQAPDLFKSQTATMISEPKTVTRPAPVETKNSSTPSISSHTEKKTSGSNPIELLGAGIFKILGLILNGFFSVLKALLGGLIHAISSTDFTEPRVKRFLYWIAASAFLIFLFVGTHFLNVKREIAMKHPARPAVQAEASEETAQSAETETAESAEESVLSIPEPPAREVKITKASAVIPTKSEAASQNLLTKEKPYAIQVATFATREDAKNLADRIAAASFPAFVKSLSRTGGKTYFCVLIGGYKTNDEAEAVLTEFKKKPIARPFRDAFARAF